MKHRIHHYPDEITLHLQPPRQGAFVAVAGRLGRYVGNTSTHLWVAWTLNKNIYQMMCAVYENVVKRGYRLTTPNP